MKALRDLYHIHPAQRNGKKLKKQKRPAASYSRTGGSRTTLGDEALDFGVRNGNRYDCLSVATGLKRP